MTIAIVPEAAGRQLPHLDRVCVCGHGRSVHCIGHSPLEIRRPIPCAACAEWEPLPNRPTPPSGVLCIGFLA